jgi:hypothetical protein
MGAHRFTASDVHPKKKHSPGVSNVVDLMRATRPRFLRSYEAKDCSTKVLMEFRAPAGQALERLTGEQLEDLGFQVVHSYGRW